MLTNIRRMGPARRQFGSYAVRQVTRISFLSIISACRFTGTRFALYIDLCGSGFCEVELGAQQALSHRVPHFAPLATSQVQKLQKSLASTLAMVFASRWQV
mmetsp:Transcript_39965/g.79052  ORF Transcript_39965/g.79052 Transcript_39965/m.79052 type:complete len:101 (-) Transcript_39965:50-352(-)